MTTLQEVLKEDYPELYQAMVKKARKELKRSIKGLNDDELFELAARFEPKDVLIQIYGMVPKGVPITEMTLSIRTFNVLNNARLTHTGDIIKAGYDKVSKYRNFGQGSLDELTAELKKLGHDFK